MVFFKVSLCCWKLLPVVEQNSNLSTWDNSSVAKFFFLLVDHNGFKNFTGGRSTCMDEICHGECSLLMSIEIRPPDIKSRQKMAPFHIQCLTSFSIHSENAGSESNRK